ncbi:hypothetical protein [Kineococcus indalonis]|uniref:hypothetical protein n=1 Tax=Kineococcus indalonis TaxID=2696566 RepID=UPI001411CA47|nr:hypothetical protein [Kineococcus indalonis]NAZ86592.1 hypothetical protein [Kineococcus indalonis]
MSTATGPVPTGHACTECTLCFRTSAQLREHVTCDHRPARDGARLIHDLLSAPPAAPAPAGATGRARAYRPLSTRFSRPAVLRFGAALAVLLWVLSTMGAPVSTLAVVGLTVALVSALIAVLEWLRVEAAPPGPHGPPD